MRRALDDRGIGSCARRMEASKSRVSHDRPEAVGSTGDALTSTRPAETTVDLHSPLNLCLLYWLYWLFPGIIDAAAVVRLSPRHCCDVIARAGEASVAFGRKPGGTARRGYIKRTSKLVRGASAVQLADVSDLRRPFSPASAAGRAQTLQTANPWTPGRRDDYSAATFDCFLPRGCGAL